MSNQQTTATVDARQNWQDALYETLRGAEVDIFCYVPDAGHRILIDRSIADDDVESIALTTEEEGVALLAGSDLGHKRAALLMQSSGLGNCVNFLTFIKAGNFPMLMLLSMRGDFGEGNPWQYPMGQAVEPICEAMGIRTLRVDHQAEVVAVAESAIDSVFKGGQSTAVLLTQKLLGAKAF